MGWYDIREQALAALGDAPTEEPEAGSVLDSLQKLTGQAAGSEAVLVNHNYGGTDVLRYVNPDGAGIDNATIRVFLTEDYSANRRSSEYVVAATSTNVDGRWARSLPLDPGSYTIVFYKQGAYGPSVQAVTVAAS